MKNVILKKGQIVVVRVGEDDTGYVCAVVMILKDFHTEDTIRKWTKQQNIKEHANIFRTNGEETDWPDWMVSEGYFKEIEYLDMNLGNDYKLNLYGILGSVSNTALYNLIDLNGDMSSDETQDVCVSAAVGDTLTFKNPLELSQRDLIDYVDVLHSYIEQLQEKDNGNKM